MISRAVSGRIPVSLLRPGQLRLDLLAYNAMRGSPCTSITRSENQWEYTGNVFGSSALLPAEFAFSSFSDPWLM